MALFYITCIILVLSSKSSSASPLSAEVLSSGDFNGYSLISPPSVNRKKVEKTFKKIKPDLPGASIITSNQDRVFYRLVSRCYSTIAPARVLQSDLLSATTSPFIAYTNNLFCVVVSSQMGRQAALAEQRQLAKKHIQTEVVTIRLPLSHWQIKSNAFADIRSAVYKATDISKKGLDTIIEPLNAKSFSSSERIAAISSN